MNEGGQESVQERGRRFDEVYKLLLGLLTLLVSFSVGFLRVIAFSLLFLYVISIVAWCFGNLIKRNEYALKSLGWYWLVLSLSSAFYRVVRLAETIQQPYIAMMAAFSAIVFLMMLAYLSPYIGRKTLISEIVIVAFFSLILVLGAW